MFRLNSALEEMLTTSMGICQTRKELFGQLFEELIRQEMIACKVSDAIFHKNFWLRHKLTLCVA